MKNYLLALIFMFLSNFIVADADLHAKNASLKDVSYAIELNVLEALCGDSEPNEGEPDELISDVSAFIVNATRQISVQTTSPQSTKDNYQPQNVRAPPVTPLS